MFFTERQSCLSLKLVLRSMAVGTQGDEVFCRVISPPAARFPVMDLHVSKRPAQLTTPSVSLQNLFAESLVLFGVESPTGLTLTQYAHSVSLDSPSPEQSLFWHCSVHRPLLGKAFYRSLSCRRAPARKSAQIISRQYPRDLSVPSIRATVSRACSTTLSWPL
jgi:hypothetical protein